ncbi:tetratricopeptide-like helical domain-containing protein [Artemisia annua]|uniref:Tetratricopeptide-like helical domain-containing protein n=1 Tax=Artemisia annua TaxID=35608 RepID=A0A2U1N1A5_ARTAN|nr:tetratricopeptide-like helical domain-containing protein [Artemisia annua]
MFVLKYGVDFDVMVQNSRLIFFMRCGKMDLLDVCLTRFHEKDTLSWNSMIFGYCNNGRIDIARELIQVGMPDRNVEFPWTSIMCGYVRVGDMDRARAYLTQCLQNTASWNVMLSGYETLGILIAAIYIFETMPYRDIGSMEFIISGCCKTGNP